MPIVYSVVNIMQNPSIEYDSIVLAHTQIRYTNRIRIFTNLTNISMKLLYQQQQKQQQYYGLYLIRSILKSSYFTEIRSYDLRETDFEREREREKQVNGIRSTHVEYKIGKQISDLKVHLFFFVLFCKINNENDEAQIHRCREHFSVVTLFLQPRCLILPYLHSLHISYPLCCAISLALYCLCPKYSFFLSGRFVYLVFDNAS